MADAAPVRIEFSEPLVSGKHKTQGTRVFVGGVEMTCVTGITLRADPDSIWKATIECIPSLPDHIVAEYVRDVTNLASTEHEFELVKVTPNG